MSGLPVHNTRPPSAWLQVQQSLRHSLLEERRVRWAPARDLAAQLLLRLDDPSCCWQAAAEWLCNHLGADRVDGGRHLSMDAPYRPQVEVRREPRELPSTLDAVFTPRSAGDAGIWMASGPSVFDDVASDRRLTERTRGQLRQLGTRSKLVLPVVQDRQLLGILCADWRAAPGPRANLEGLTEACTSVLAPLLRTAQELADQALDTGPPARPAILAELTAAELCVAQLVAQGCSYKEIARRLDRAFSTIDHHLRSIRSKLGVASTARLTAVLTRAFDPH